MAATAITKDIYSVGVLNPNLRIFDIVMKTEYGTTYNSYLVKGSEKTALIETAHAEFFDAYWENVKSVAEMGKIEYLVMNHNEPDHSGVIARVLEIMPDITVVASQAGAIYLKNIVNRSDMKLMVVKDGDVIDLGGKTLRFISAPFLHWPDSMFTWVEEDKTLFSCDFLGSHYCEPNVFDTRMIPKFKCAYDSAMKGYYDAIFGPFKPYVLKGLEKIKDLDIEFACVSHGPVLTKGGLLGETIELYRAWSTPIRRDKPVIPLFFCSAYNNTELLANAIAKGISEKKPEAEVTCYDLNHNSMEDMASLLNSCDAFLVGSPTLNKDAVQPIWILLSHIDAINISKRPAAIFGSYGWSGEACGNIRGRLESLKLAVYQEDFKVVLVPTSEDLKNAEKFGRDFADTINL